MITNTEHNPSKVFPILMTKQMAKSLKEAAIDQDRSASDIVRMLLSEFLPNKSNEEAAITPQRV